MNKYKKALFNLLDRAIEARDGKSILKPHEKTTNCYGNIEYINWSMQ